ncbi:hypothetical protein GCM10010435_37630 [Winogradskya consettensis]|uniref:Uncharacterized protein n=1 Tax=Winogradskya consettensis TaxID=113560 RepID=A0A919T151_9ACTN|nr:hypothetical protein Aco04nite_88460 [Actinoplanes consettensis]
MLLSRLHLGQSNAETMEHFSDFEPIIRTHIVTFSTKTHLDDRDIELSATQQDALTVWQSSEGRVGVNLVGIASHLAPVPRHAQYLHTCSSDNG